MAIKLKNKETFILFDPVILFLELFPKLILEEEQICKWWNSLHQCPLKWEDAGSQMSESAHRVAEWNVIQFQQNVLMQTELHGQKDATWTKKQKTITTTTEKKTNPEISTCLCRLAGATPSLAAQSWRGAGTKQNLGFRWWIRDNVVVPLELSHHHDVVCMIKNN